MVGKSRMRRQRLKVRWAESKGALAAAERDERDLGSWHECQEIHGCMTEQSASCFLTGFVTADGCRAMVNEREIF